MKTIKEIYIDCKAADTPLARAITQQPGDARVVHVEGLCGVYRALESGANPGEDSAKDRLFVTREEGRFLRPCPGTPGMECCNLFVLNPLVGCPFDCAYCFLQAYQSDPFITLYANLEEIEQEVAALRDLNPGKTVRICTGELADALALDPLVQVAPYLVELFAGMEGATLELKTKATVVDHLLSLRHNNRTVLSFTLNTAEVAAREEAGTPPPAARLDAAQRACRAGYPLAIHFDPLVRYPGWAGDYAGLVSALFEAIPPEAMQWISLGGFRYTPAMKQRIKERFPATRLFLGEFVSCADGKYRYFRKHRIELYRLMRDEIARRAPEVPVYLCMEAAHMWRAVFGYLPEERGCLEDLFGERGFPCAGARGQRPPPC